jgi:hypothetical protein
MKKLLRPNCKFVLSIIGVITCTGIEAKKPNILLIFSDDHAKQALSPVW